MFKLNIEQAETQSNRTKKAPEGANFNNGGKEEGRNRDLLRYRGVKQRKMQGFQLLFPILNLF